jgi:hypothetical protein
MPCDPQRDEAYALLDGVEVAILRPGGEDAMPHGMIGEVVLERAVGNSPSAHRGALSALEQVPHRYRKPGLQGWLGFAQPVASVQDHAVQASDMARLVSEVDELLDARLLIAHDQDGATPVLQIETEAGALDRGGCACPLRGDDRSATADRAPDARQVRQQRTRLCPEWPA